MKKLKAFCRFMLLHHIAFLQGIEVVFWQEMEVQQIPLAVEPFWAKDCVSLENLMEIDDDLECSN
jgi:hypothetical protein